MIKSENWQQRLNFTQKELIKQSFYLLDWAKNQKRNLYDYSFVVMPAAKAYEGFLKQWLFDLGLISREKLERDRFRIGKALNPELEHIKNLRKHCLFEEISQKCSQETARTLWQTWKKCRNRVFHYFYKEQQVFTLEESENRLDQIIKAIELASRNC